jgi:membrane-bound inhibitor of C-type lysozyme
MQHITNHRTRGLRKGIGALLLLPSCLLASSSALVSWQANSEADLAGYRVYYGTASKTYTASPINVGKTTQYTVNNLTSGTTYYFAVTAYDTAGNESGFSSEVPYTSPDTDPPTLVSASCLLVDKVGVKFSEPLDATSAQIRTNYTISGNIVVTSAVLQSDKMTVYLFTTQHANGNYTLTVSGVKDTASVPNTIASGSQTSYAWSSSDVTPPALAEAPKLIRYTSNDFLLLSFTKPMNQTSVTDTSNYTISPSSVTIKSASVTDATLQKVLLTTTLNVPGDTYTLTVKNVTDASGNKIATTSQQYVCSSEDQTPPKLIAARPKSSNQIELEFNEVLDSTTAQTKANYSFSPPVAVQSAVLNSDKLHVTLNTGNLASGNNTVTVIGVGDAAVPSNLITASAPEQKTFTYVPPDTVKPTLVNVHVKNTDGTLLEVVFSEKVDRTSAENTDNYQIDPPVAIQRAVLSDSTVLLITAAHTAGTYQLIVNNVKDLASTPNVITINASKVYSFTSLDVTPPQLVQPQLHGSKVLELDFSEPLDLASSQNKDNYLITPSVAIQSASRVDGHPDQVYLTTEDHVPGQSYTITVKNVMDQAVPPNAMTAVSKRYDAPMSDTTPPHLTNVIPNESYLQLEFDEMLDPTSAQNKDNYQTSPSVGWSNASLTQSGKTVFLMVDGHFSLGTKYTLTTQNIKDLASNAIVPADNVKPFQLDSPDKESPRLTRAEIINEKTVELYFSEPIDATSVQPTTNYSITNGPNSITVSQAVLVSGNQEVMLLTSNHMQGTYTIKVKGVTDKAATPNTIAAPYDTVSYKYEPSDTIPPVLTGAVSVGTTQIRLTFNEPLNPSSVGDTLHYQVNNGIRVYQSYLDGTSSIVLVTSGMAAGEYKITVSGVEDASGARNKMTAVTRNFNCVIEDKTPPTLVLANMLNSCSLDVKFSKALDAASAQTSGNYVLTSGADVQYAKLTQSQDEVILTTTEHAPGTYKLTVNGVKDASINQNTIAAFSQIPYTWSPVDTTAPALTGATLVSNTCLNLQFSEQMESESANNKDNYTITPAVRIYSATLTGTRDQVQLITDPHDKGVVYQVKASNLKDRAFTSNPIGSKNTYQYSYSPPDTSAPKLLSCLMNVSPQVLRLGFDEILSRQSAEIASNYQIDHGIQVIQATLTASLTEVDLETSSHDAGVNYTIRIQGIQDRAAVPNTVINPIKWQYSYTPADTTAPVLMNAKLQDGTDLELLFSEAVDPVTAAVRSNYLFDQAIEVVDVSFDPNSPERVYLQTSQHFPDWQYKIRVQNVKDKAPKPNITDPNHWVYYSFTTAGTMADHTAPSLARVDVLSSTQIDLLFSKPIEKTSAESKSNYTIDDGVVIKSVQLDDNTLRVHLKTTPHDLDRSYKVSVSNIKDKSVTANVLSSASVSYFLAKGISINGVKPSRYVTTVCGNGLKGYMDRDYTFTQIPEALAGVAQIQTSNDDKTLTDGTFMQFELGGDATVYVGFDKHIETRPDWLLSGWTATGDQVVDSRSNVFQLYSKDFAEGRVILGGNGGTVDDNMYHVFIKPLVSSGKVLSRLNKTSYQTTRAATGDEPYYIDRTYTLAAIPDSLTGLTMIRTANDDKTNGDAEFLTFTLDQDATVYVAYDARIGTLPEWLSKWKRFDGQIVDSRGQAFSVYAQPFSAGDVTLGGNGGTIDDNMYFVLIKPTGDGAVVESELPGYFTLNQNYPNPFNPETRIYFRAHKSGHVLLSVFNILGQRVRILVDRDMEAGHQEEVVWNGRNQHDQPVASGFYFYRIEQSHFALTKRMLLLR